MKNQPSIIDFVLVLIFILAYSSGIAQNITFNSENFNQAILSYQPTQRDGVSDKDFSRGTFYLEQTAKSSEGNPDNLNAVDYWNITMAFIKLQEPKEHIALSFQKAADSDPKSLCSVLDAYGEKTLTYLAKHIPERSKQFYAGCADILAQEEIFDPVAYAEEQQVDLGLVKLMAEINETDQMYRNEAEVDWSLQTPLDERNMEIIDSLYQQHKTYVGKGLVGKKFSSTMWAVIQHSTIEKMEEYLPIVHAGVQAGDLHPTPLKMLIDRIHVIKHGYQFFGSQGGAEIASDEARAEIEKTYGLK
ncbi:MAG: hypothetical protein HRU41_02840 [Saprospiraceae bacterium]|nr:hypothetical protein [Saprospiraceae bacterium]